MTEGGINDRKSKGQGKVICNADFFSNYLLPLSYNDNLNQEENQLKKFEHFIVEMEEAHVLKKKESTHNSKCDSVYDELVFMLESEIRLLRGELA